MISLLNCQLVAPASRQQTRRKSTFIIMMVRGNVTAVTDGTQQTVAQYEYDAYGNLINSNGAYALQNPWRFSTKYYDGGSGLYYYGYRFYSPGLGKWINRDPVAESGGLNLYGFGPNSPLNGYDLYGLDWVDDASSFFGGWGDTLTYGGTKQVRKWMGTDGFVDSCSRLYQGGAVVGDVHQRFLTRGRGSGVLVKKLKKFPLGKTKVIQARSRGRNVFRHFPTRKRAEDAMPHARPPKKGQHRVTSQTRKKDQQRGKKSYPNSPYSKGRHLHDDRHNPSPLFGRDNNHYLFP